MCIFTAVSSVRIDLIVAISVSVAVITLGVGLFAGSLITYCFRKKTTQQIVEGDSSFPQKPLYEEIPPSNLEIEMRKNDAYGPATGKWTHIMTVSVVNGN